MRWQKRHIRCLQACEDINFIGNIEARDIPYGKADVIVCEAFVGNVILKLYEGLAGALLQEDQGRHDVFPAQ